MQIGRNAQVVRLNRDFFSRHTNDRKLSRVAAGMPFAFQRLWFLNKLKRDMYMIIYFNRIEDVIVLPSRRAKARNDLKKFRNLVFFEIPVIDTTVTGPHLFITTSNHQCSCVPRLQGELISVGSAQILMRFLPFIPPVTSKNS